MPMGARNSSRAAARRRRRDDEVSQLNEIANGLAIASLALEAEDEQTARLALRETRRRASDLLGEAVDEIDARERRRRHGLITGGAAVAVAAAIGLSVTPPEADRTPVAVEELGTPAEVRGAERALASRTADPAAADELLRPTVAIDAAARTAEVPSPTAPAAGPGPTTQPPAPDDRSTAPAAPEQDTEATDDKGPPAHSKGRAGPHEDGHPGQDGGQRRGHGSA